MAITYEEINPSLIPNTTMQKGFLNGVHRTYRITPNDGYVLHVKEWDNTAYDENGNETDEVILGYQRGMASVGFNYDFSTIEVTAIDGSIVTAYGSKEFYAIPASLVPENQIHGTTPSNPPTEIM